MTVPLQGGKWQLQESLQETQSVPVPRNRLKLLGNRLSRIDRLDWSVMG